MNTTLVIQSYRSKGEKPWISTCLESVERWSMRQGYDYRFVDDDIFTRVPNWYMEKVRHKLPVATDYGRLVLLHEALTVEKYQRAIWFDADTLVFNQDMVLDFDGTCAFGQELWVQQDSPAKQKLRVTKNVHNALCIFNQDCPVLPFLIQTVSSIIQRVVAEKISPQMVGPKLLTALHNIAGFSLLGQVGALSPLVLENICQGGGKALQLLCTKQKINQLGPMYAANLCASLINDDLAEKSISCLLTKGCIE